MLLKRVWKNNRGIISEIENNTFYIKEYYNQVLSKLSPQEIYEQLDNSVLLCYEDNNEFCHRHIVSAWLELFLDIEVNEKSCENDFMKTIEKPAYIKETLENIVKKEVNMRGFHSLRALYLFELGEKCEMKAHENERKNYDSYMQAACFYRCDADEAEAIYNFNKFNSFIKL